MQINDYKSICLEVESHKKNITSVSSHFWCVYIYIYIYILVGGVGSDLSFFFWDKQDLVLVLIWPLWHLCINHCSPSCQNHYKLIKIPTHDNGNKPLTNQ